MKEFQSERTERIKEGLRSRPAALSCSSCVSRCWSLAETRA